MHALISSLAFWLSATVVCSQVIRVDPSGRGDYREIRDAVAAASDGATIVVAPGRYDTFQVAGKALTLIGASPDTTVISDAPPRPPASVSGLTGSQQTWISGIGFEAVDIKNCLGSVVVEGCRVRTLGVTRSRAVLFLDSAVGNQRYSTTPVSAVRVDHSTVRLESCGLYGREYLGVVVVTAQSASLELIDCEVSGSPGRATLLGQPATDGGDAIQVRDCRLLLVGGSVRGGVGGADPVTNRPGAGGDAVIAQGSGSLILRGTRVIAGGAGMPGTAHGRGLVVDSSVATDLQPGRRTPSAWLEGFGRRGTRVSVHVTAAAGSLAVFGLGKRFAFHSLAPLSVSRATILPAWVSPPLRMPIGSARVDLAIPAAAPLHAGLAGQFFVVEPDGTFCTSNSITLHVDR